jgi:hypothetical protein
MYRKQKFLAGFIFSILFFITAPVQLVFAAAPDAAQSSLSPTTPGSDTAYADGTTQAKMTLTLKDSGGTALAGDTVTLSISTDASAVITPTTTVLDSNGQAQFTFTSTQIGDDWINVSDDTQAATLSALAKVQFTAIPGATDHNASATPPCNQTAPNTAPDLYQVNLTGTKATLFFSPPADTFDSYTISYGFTSSADNYSVVYPQGRTEGAATYVISSLNANTSYYFKVRANNGCAAGPWSSVKQAGKQLSQLPETGPSWSLIATGVFGMALFAAGIFLVVL